MKLNRRDFLKLSGGAAAGSASLVVWSGSSASSQDKNATGVTLEYPQQEVGKAAELEAGRTQSFMYPDDSSPCAMVKMGEPVAGGVGPDGDIVAYSTLCTHMGCGVSYDRERRVFKCPCHYSMFDPGQEGQQVCGQATVDLPRIELEYDEDRDQITAVGVRGLIYGRQANIL